MVRGQTNGRGYLCLLAENGTLSELRLDGEGEQHQGAKGDRDIRQNRRICIDLVRIGYALAARSATRIS